MVSKTSKQAKCSLQADLADYSSRTDTPTATTVGRWEVIGSYKNLRFDNRNTGRVTPISPVLQYFLELVLTWPYWPWCNSPVAKDGLVSAIIEPSPTLEKFQDLNPDTHLYNVPVVKQ